MTENSTFEDAFSICFAYYFIFNVAYPKKTTLILETVQSYFLKIYPDSGKKGTLPRSKKRVINFINMVKAL